MVSEEELQKEHIDGRELPSSMRLSSVGNLLCMSLQINKDLEGEMSGFQIILAHERF